MLLMKSEPMTTEEHLNAFMAWCTLTVHANTRTAAHVTLCTAELCRMLLPSSMDVGELEA